MLKFQIALVAILACCIAFVSCERAQQVLAPVTEEVTTEEATDTPEADTAESTEAEGTEVPPTNGDGTTQ